jgi:L-alanine-DL-glutamate epimerase-like enolase superfamily enzyme
MIDAALRTAVIEQPISIKTAEMHFYGKESAVADELAALVRVRRGLRPDANVVHGYLRLLTTEGVEGWYGPFDAWSGVCARNLERALRAIGDRTTVIAAQRALGSYWEKDSTSCAAIDGALWDVASRARAVPLWQALAAGSEKAGEPRYYGSALGLGPADNDLLGRILAAGYPVAKWSLRRDGGEIDVQLARIAKGGAEWASIALDAHATLSLVDVRRVQERAPTLAWLEDPFALDCPAAWDEADAYADGDLPRIVAGEQAARVGDLVRLAARRSVAAAHIEVERLGLTRALEAIAFLRSMRRKCLLHGRMLLPATHLAAAYPDTVSWVECNLVFAAERLATIRDAGLGRDPRCVARECLDRVGGGSEPGEECVLQNVETLLRTETPGRARRFVRGEGGRE